MRAHLDPVSRSGFTLIELMVTCAIIGIATSIALPKIGAVRDQLTLDAAAQELMHQLELARSEAIKRNQPLSLHRLSGTTYQVGTLAPRALPGRATFVSGTTDSVRFASFGPPTTGAASFQLQIGSRVKTVRVNAAGYPSYDP